MRCYGIGAGDGSANCGCQGRDRNFDGRWTTHLIDE